MINRKEAFWTFSLCGLASVIFACITGYGSWQFWHIQDGDDLYLRIKAGSQAIAIFMGLGAGAFGVLAFIGALGLAILLFSKPHTPVKTTAQSAQI